MDGNGLLSLLTFFPLVGIVVILLLKPLKRESDNLVRYVAITTSIITFFVALAVLLFAYDSNKAGLQLIDQVEWIPALGVTYFLAVDGLSILFVMLTVFITPLAIISSWSQIQEQIKAYYVFMLLMEVAMIGVFLAQDLFLFYIFWEFTLIPMYFLIGIWGGEKRVYASIKFFLYTMAGSLLMLLAILYLGLSNDSFSVPGLIANNSAFAESPIQQLLFLGFAIAFAIKVPIFPFHSWLPDAHTEAPTAGSIILAGILLKMGTYGFVRFNLPLFPQASFDFAPYIAVLAIIGIIYGRHGFLRPEGRQETGSLLQCESLGICHTGHFFIKCCRHRRRDSARRQSRIKYRSIVLFGWNSLRAAAHTGNVVLRRRLAGDSNIYGLIFDSDPV